MKKKIIAGLISLTLAAALSGCTTQSPAGASTDPDAGVSGDTETAETPAGAETATDDEIVIGMCPKLMNDGYMIAAGAGAQEACDELGYRLDFNGPVSADITEQSDIINQWTQKGYSAITISANDPDALAPAMQAAKDAGICTSAWDADVSFEARDLFLNQATYEGIGTTMVDELAKAGVTSGNVLVVTSTLTAPNQNAWLKVIEDYLEENYPDIKIVDVLPGNEDLAESKDVTYNYLMSHNDTVAVIGLSGNATPGVCEAVEQLDLAGKIKVVGIAVPSTIGDYLKSGTCNAGILWSPQDIGYCAIYMAKAQLEGTWEEQIASGEFDCGSRGKKEVIDKENGIILLGDPTVFTAENVDNYDF